MLLSTYLSCAVLYHLYNWYCFMLDFFVHLRLCVDLFFFFKQKTAYEMRISDWSSDVCSSDLRVVSRPVVQPTSAAPRENASQAPQPVSRIAQNSPQRRMTATTGSASATHLVQLGSFSSRANAERASEIYQKRYPQLDGRDMVITQAQVNGKTYFRVAAAGFGPGEAAGTEISRREAGGRVCQWV